MCSVLTIVSVVSHADPVSGAPASWQAPVTEADPNPSFVDVASVAALNGQQFNAFTIRSSISFEVQVQVLACSSECTDSFIPTSANTAQTPAISLSNWLYFDSEGAYTNLGTPWSFGCYWSLSSIQPLSGSEDGWNVSVTWINGTLSHLYCATGIGDHYNNPPGQSQLSLSSGVTQFVPADHPYLMVDWFPPDTSGALHITQVCVEAHHS